MRMLGNQRVKEYLGGGLMVLIGGGAIAEGSRYSIGSLESMGPGFFPVSLGVLLALVGALLLISARVAALHTYEKPLPPEWRGWILICLAVIAFAVLGKYAGLVPATFAIVFISALGDRQNTIKSALLLALAMVVFAVVVFAWALNMQFPLFAWGW